jgi:hypothetical protein
MDYPVQGIVVELDIYEQETFIVLCIIWTLKFQY